MGGVVGGGGTGAGGMGPDMRMSAMDAERVNSEIRRRSLANGFGLHYLTMGEEDSYSAMVSPVQFSPSVTLEDVMAMPPAVQMMAGYGGAMMGHYNTAPGTQQHQQTSGPSSIMMAAPASPVMAMPQGNRLSQQQQSLQPMTDVNMGPGPGPPRGTFWSYSPYNNDEGGPRLGDEPEIDGESPPLASPQIAPTHFPPAAQATATSATGAVVEASNLGTLEKPPAGHGGMVPSKFPENIYSSSGFNMLDILVSMNFISCSRAYTQTLHSDYRPRMCFIFILVSYSRFWNGLLTFFGFNSGALQTGQTLRSTSEQWISPAPLWSPMSESTTTRSSIAVRHLSVSQDTQSTRSSAAIVDSFRRPMETLFGDRSGSIATRGPWRI